jgi:CHAD domain-containing protein
VRKQIKHLVEQVNAVPADSPDPSVQHRLRILSKRLRYGVENLRSLLPQKPAARWLKTATQAQTQIGMTRDRQRAIAIAQRLQAADGVVQFLRGAAFGASPTDD